MKIIKTKEHKNGSVTLTYTLTKKEEKLLSIIATERGKIYNEKFIHSLILKAINNSIKKEIL